MSGSAAGRSRLEIIPAEDRHAPELTTFLQATWSPEATVDSVTRSRAVAAARNVADPGLPPPTWIAVQAGRVLGFVTTIPIRVWDGAADWPAYWVKGLMVLPEFRNGPVGYAVLKAAVAALPRSGGLAVAAPARRLFTALGYTDLGAVANWIRPLAPHRIMESLDPAALGIASLPSWVDPALRVARATRLATVGGWAGGVALRAAAGAMRLASVGLVAEPADPEEIAPEIDRLWESVRPGLPRSVVRNSAYLLPRYPAGNMLYRWLAARDGTGLLRGIAIVRQPRVGGDGRLRGIRVATLSDLLFRVDDRAAGLALLGAAERAARDLGGDAILASTSSPAVTRLLRRQWYLPLSGNVHLLVRDVTKDSALVETPLSDWWLMRGDGGSDEVF